jgi:Gluconate 2-dehydrogenase subunit 3
MKRRDFIKSVVAATAAAPAALGQQTAPSVAQKSPPVPKAPGPLPWMRGLMEVKPLPMTPLVADAVAQTDANFFSATQTATLRRLAEVFQPAMGGYPSAVEAGAVEFLEFLIGASPDDRQHMYTQGLDRLDAESKAKFNTSFASTDSKQGDQLLRPWLRAWMPEHPPAEPYARFINLVHFDIRTATMNSQAWADVARAHGQQPPDVDLYWYPVEPDIRSKGAISTAITA